MNKTEVLCRLAGDAKATQVGNKYAINFTAVHSEKYKTKEGEQKESTTWFGCTYWTNTNNLAQYLTKGTQVLVSGKISAETYEKDGEAKASLKLTIKELFLISKVNSSEKTVESTGEEVAGDDDLPF